MTPEILFKCLSDETRLKSVILIAHYGELCVCDLIEMLQLPQPKISRHLAMLRMNDLLVTERRENWVYYSLNPNLEPWALELIKLTLEKAKVFSGKIPVKSC
ncbi:metalloregulator ArsR/SmtB family transcription factor [Kangiella sp.]|uniref:metalloregulator ArsR/SmtB family transcription factor n=1 Tax=Kangiella sp. TaxID=1920245 RepID=UPI0019920229|nr:metalloregulator ArsR/SmtB family transcription factor [Kangiella sp.]MBD3654851.1 metalloregulator ArsR/SmtB family transcription factor [Kangiella sp.]